jgi:formate hydrogenlyase transcriptional activator
MATMSLGARSTAVAAVAPAWNEEVESGGGQSVAAMLDVSNVRESWSSAFSAHGIIGHSTALTEVMHQVTMVAPLDATVLLLGETGTGKELIAQAIHAMSRRRAAPLVKVNCAALPVGLLESELFGRERGAYTGAVTPQPGRFELAHRGTLFLDEVGEMPAESQVKLLRVLQEQEFERLGGGRTIRVDVRLVAATNGDLRAMVDARQFRGDLFYRLNVFPIRLPALRERREDIRPLAEHFVRASARRFGRRIHAIPEATFQELARYDWPGNVRELQNFLERAVILSPGSVLRAPIAELRGEMRESASRRAATAVTETSGSVVSLRDSEREHILRALQATSGVVGGPHGAAARLGVKRTTLIAKMARLGIGRELAGI